jgi:hypothetical protein
MARSVRVVRRLRYLGQTDGHGDSGLVDLPCANCGMGIQIWEKFRSTLNVFFLNRISFHLVIFCGA